MPGRIRTLLVVAVLGGLWLGAFAARELPPPGPQMVPPGTEPAPFYPGLTTATVDHLASLVQMIVLLLSAAGLGAWLLGWVGIRPDDGLTRGASGVGVGLGVYSLGALALGAAGTLNPYLFVAIPVLALIVGGRELSAMLSGVRKCMAAGLATFSAYRMLIWIVPVFFLVMHVLHAFIPPLQYDVLEYHLAAPMRYWRAGRVFFIHDNVYANFPQGVEMLNLWALVLKGQLYEELYLAQLLNVGLGVWAACCVGAAARRMFGRGAAGPAGVLFYVLPWTVELSRPAYVELALTGYAVLTIAAFVGYLSDRSWRWAALAGLMAGLAFGCKYPAALFLIVPLLAALAVVNRTDVGRLWRHVAVAGVAVLVVASPWLIRSTVNTGNPVYPLLYSTLGGRTWSPEQSAKFMRAHSPQNVSRREMISKTSRFFTQGDIEGTAKHKRMRTTAYGIVAALILIGLAMHRNKSSAVVAGAVVLSWVLWLLLTHRIGRFLVPWTSIAVVFAGGAFLAMKSRLAANLFVVAATVVGLLAAGPTFMPLEALLAAVGGIDESVFMNAVTEVSNYSHAAIEQINGLPDGSRALFVGEAETLYCTGDIVAPTVFDRHPLEELLGSGATAAEVAQKLTEAGITHLYINLPEFRRLRDSYDYQYEFDGRSRVGLWNIDDDAWRELARFTRGFCEPVWQAGAGYGRALSPSELARFQAFDRRAPGRGRMPYGHYIYRMKERD